MKRPTTLTAASLAALSLTLAACGGADDATPDADIDDTADTDQGSDPGGALPLEGVVEIATGTTLDLTRCPDDWDPFTGVDGDEIRIGQSLPQSGQLAAFGAIGEGIEMYFEHVNDTDPIDGKRLVLVARDDGYEAGRTVANVEEMIDSEDVFMLAHIIGTPNNLAARSVTDEACVPQLWNGTGFPLWGDPANFPWTVGNVLNYATETEIWCSSIIDEHGEGATVAALIMNNDFGATYLDTLAESDACAGVELVAEQRHDQAAPDVNNEMTTLIDSDADVLLAGTTAAFCPQVTANLAASAWRPSVYMSYTCNNLASFFAPVRDAAETLYDEGSGVRMTNNIKVCGDPAFDDDPAVRRMEEILVEYGGVTCADGAYSTGVLYGTFVEDLLRATLEMPGGINRVNLMAALWNFEGDSDLLLGGTLALDGVDDAYWTEAAQVQQVAVIDGTLTFEPVGDLVDFEGQGGSYGD